MTNYVEQYVDFLVKNSSNFRLTNYRQIDIQPSEVIINDSIEDRLFENKACLPNLLETLMFFNLLDSYVEQQNPALEGLSFRQKYKEMPSETNINKMIKSIYRILKIYRNASVHSVSSIVNNERGIKLSYAFKETNYMLNISNESLHLIYSFILNYLILSNSIYSDLYVEYLLFDIYELIISGVNSFVDEEGGLTHVPTSKKICWRVRYKCDSISISEINSNIKFEIPDDYCINKQDEPIDIYIVHNDNKYIIPIEVIEQSKTISAIELEKYKQKSI